MSRIGTDRHGKPRTTAQVEKTARDLKDSTGMTYDQARRRVSETLERKDKQRR